jgi:hypothetical protein
MKMDRAAMHRRAQRAEADLARAACERDYWKRGFAAHLRDCQDRRSREVAEGVRAYQVRVSDRVAQAIALTLFFLALLLLSGCATPPEPKIQTVQVKVPVVRPCVPADTPKPPAHYADDAITDATPPDQFVILTAKANQERRKRLADVEPIISACR